MKRIPTKHARIWLVVDGGSGHVYGVYMKKNAAARESNAANEELCRDVYGVRPAFTSNTRKGSDEKRSPQTVPVLRGVRHQG